MMSTMMSKFSVADDEALENYQEPTVKESKVAEENLDVANRIVDKIKNTNDIGRIRQHDRVP